MSQHEGIRARAEQLWRELGCPDGRDEEIWLMAEEAVKRESTVISRPAAKSAAKVAAAPKAAAPRAPAAKKADTAKPVTKGTASKEALKK